LREKSCDFADERVLSGIPLAGMKHVEHVRETKSGVRQVATTAGMNVIGLCVQARKRVGRIK